MRTVIHVESRKLEGYRLPPLAMGSCGCPIVPRKGDVVGINNVVLVVDEVLWTLNHNIEENVVAIYLKEVPPEPPTSNIHSIKRILASTDWQCEHCKSVFANPRHAIGAYCPGAVVVPPNPIIQTGGGIPAVRSIPEPSPPFGGVRNGHTLSLNLDIFEWQCDICRRTFKGVSDADKVECEPLGSPPHKSTV